jgi:hypothetical protein
MKRKLASVTILFLILLALGGATALADCVTSWSFRAFDNPNARQVALNIANRQSELAMDEDEDKTPMERFQESLERMQMSKVIQDLIYFEEDRDRDFSKDDNGYLPLGDSWLYWEWDASKQTMTVWYWESEGWVVQPFERNDKPDPPHTKK